MSSLKNPQEEQLSFSEQKQAIMISMEQIGRGLDHYKTLARINSLLHDNPKECDDIFDITPKQFFNNETNSLFSPIWITLSTYRPDLASKFLNKAVTEISSDHTWTKIAEIITPTPNLSMVKDLVEHANKINPDVKPDIIRNLFWPALTHAIKSGNGTDLFDYLMEHEEIVNIKWADHYGAGNAIYLWMQAQRGVQPGAGREDSLYILKKLLEAGVKVDDESHLYHEEEKLEFTSLLDAACWGSDEGRGGYTEVLDIMLRVGIPWGDRDTGDELSATYIQDHPFVQAKKKTGRA